MFLYLIDLDDTLVDTRAHAISTIYPAVARALGVAAPSPVDVQACWGQPFDAVLPRLFCGTDAGTVLDELRRQHRVSPPPAFDGVVRRLHELVRSPSQRLVIYSAGDPAIVLSSITLSLQLQPNHDVTVHHLPPGRRLAPVDVDLLSDSCALSGPEAIFVISDSLADGSAVAQDRKARFYGICPSDSTNTAGTARANVFPRATDALDAIGRAHGATARERDLSSLEIAIRDRKLLVFLGAGVSIDSGLPSGGGLARQLDAEGAPLDRTMTALGSDPTLYTRLHRIFAARGLRPNRIHRALALLDAPYYIGTNWDQLLEKAFKDLYGDRYDEHVGVAYEDGQLPAVYGKRNAYLKLHGDIESRDSLVHDQLSYARILEQPTLVAKLVEVLLNTSVVMFVGYSISDLNVLSGLLKYKGWLGGAPPERYALLPAPSAVETGSLNAAGVRVIDVSTGASGNVTDQVFDVLAHLYDAQDDFASDVQLLSGARDSSPAELFYEALAHYNASDYGQALNAIEQIRSKALDWRQEPSLFARFCYLVVKLYDKLERWDALAAMEDLYIADHLRRAESIMPGATFEWLRGHHSSALALAALRAGRPEEALRHADSAIGAARRQSRRSRLLLSDRRVVRAMAVQYLARCGDAERLDSAWDDLAYARSALERFGGLGTANEGHFAGRFYGATVFLALTDTREVPYPGRPKLQALASSALRAHDAPNRVPYGVLAGRYCDTYFRWKTGAADLQHSMSLLASQRDAVEIGPSVAEKIDVLLAAASGGQRSDQWARTSAYAARHIEQIGIEGWLGTPIN